ncbi:Transmembrane osmosensor [Mortierella sp. 14UC]|nr:Transmembrane osmosensor [Mortierella sp. 14UC]
MATRPQLQSFRRGPSGLILQLEAHFHADSNQHIVFWDDIIEAFPGATSVRKGNVVVTRARDSSFRVLEPRCIKYQEGSLLEVMGGEELGSSLLGSARTLTPTPMLGQTAVPSPELTRRNIEQWAAMTAPEDMLLENNYAPTICTHITVETRPFRPLMVPTESETSSVITDGTEDNEEKEDNIQEGSQEDDHNGNDKEARKSWFSAGGSSVIYRMAKLFAIPVARGAVGAGITESAIAADGAATLNSGMTPDGDATYNGNPTPSGATTPNGTDTPNGVIDSPQLQDNNNLSAVEVATSLNYTYKARALYSHRGNPFDTNELEFVMGEVLDIVDVKDKWWQARKQDGTVGIAYSALAAIAFVSAQADPMTPAGAVQPTYDWASIGDENQLVAQLEDLSYQIFEGALRTQLLSSIDEIAPATAAGEGITTLVGGLGGLIGTILNKFIAPIKAPVGDINTESSSTVATIVFGAMSTAIMFLKGIGLGPLGTFITPVVGILEKIKDLLQTVLIYKTSGGISGKIELESLPKDQVEDLQRYLDGAVAIIDNVAKTSVAPTNDALLASRPIFSADVLEQIYRRGLEVCLRIAADPAAAAEKVNEDEDEDFEDEDEENEENHENNEDEE